MAKAHSAASGECKPSSISATKKAPGIAAAAASTGLRRPPREVLQPGDRRLQLPCLQRRELPSPSYTFHQFFSAVSRVGAIAAMPSRSAALSSSFALNSPDSYLLKDFDVGIGGRGL